MRVTAASGSVTKKEVSAISAGWKEGQAAGTNGTECSRRFLVRALGSFQSPEKVSFDPLHAAYFITALGCEQQQTHNASVIVIATGLPNRLIAPSP